jgi:hypothetical protein
LREHIDFHPVSKRDYAVFTNHIGHEIRIRFEEESRKDRLAQILDLSQKEQIEVLKELVQFETDINIARSTVKRHVTSRDLAIALLV